LFLLLSLLLCCCLVASFALLPAFI
jgi:hypothetical protein